MPSRSRLVLLPVPWGALALAAAWVALWASPSGCGPRPGTVSIDVVTDLIAGVEIFTARDVGGRATPGS